MESFARRNHAVGAAVFIALGVFAAPAFAQTVPDFNGVWVMADTVIDKPNPAFLFAPPRANSNALPSGPAEPLPKPKGEYLMRQQQDMAAAARGVANDPTSNCLAQGMPRFWRGPYAWEFIQNAKQINIFQEWNDQVRRIYLDGRKHPEDMDPNYNGHSVGHWEGDTLVVETVGFNDKTLLREGGPNHSASMRTLERIQPTGPDLITVTVTTEDTEALEEPWTFTRVLRRKPGMEVWEYNCNENNRDVIGADGVATTILKSE